MKAIILAAGKGSRLKGAAGNNPKCLARVGEMTLIERQILALRSCGVDDIAVVIGFGADAVRRVCGPELEYIENTIFFRTSSLYSLWLSRNQFGDEFVVLNSDVLFHPQLLSDLLTSRYEDALLIAYKNNSNAPLGDEEMKVKVRAGMVVEINKTMNPNDADGENVGIVKFGAAGSALLKRLTGALIAKGAYHAWAPRAFREFAVVRPLHVIDTRGLPWIEIDFPEDYHRAINEVLPEIDGCRFLFERPSMVAAAAVEGV
jgi:choline kinase